MDPANHVKDTMLKLSILYDDSIQFNKDTLTLKTRTCDIQDYWANVELGQLDQSDQWNVTWGRYRNHAWSIVIISKRMRKPQMTLNTFVAYSRDLTVDWRVYQSILFSRFSFDYGLF